jgi:hypothetical protein
LAITGLDYRKNGNVGGKKTKVFLAEFPFINPNDFVGNEPAAFDVSGRQLLYSFINPQKDCDCCKPRRKLLSFGPICELSKHD